jgi:biopolymer transport protein ExbD
MDEVQRSYDYGLELYFVATEDLTTLSKTIHKIPKFRLTAVENTHFEQFMQLQDKLKECGYKGVIVSGADLAWVVRRCIKHYIKKNKIQYW